MSNWDRHRKIGVIDPTITYERARTIVAKLRWVERMSLDLEEEVLLEMSTIGELQALDEGSGFFAELVSEFNAQNQRLVKNIGEGALDCNYDQLLFNTHTLKGSSLNVGALRQAKIARLMEEASKAEDCTTVNQYLPTLIAIAAETEGALRSLV